MDSLNRDSQPRFSELCQLSGSNGLSTQLNKAIQGHFDSPKLLTFVESPPNLATQPTPHIHCPHRTNFNFDMPSSNNKVKIIDPALATMVKVFNAVILEMLRKTQLASTLKLLNDKKKGLRTIKEVSWDYYVKKSHGRPGGTPPGL
ncbi:hypothetical protein PGT21_030024 [Puccinia graminis f. sp. tritici]|uniref:Uncharacterized protein n=1 Tax=Puccinia graminis f. sp. tritici TaxID=56615 RepID=A0A5B0QJM4_PUCGR|nr:hypothetical protein PGT21_030024 [Puccinia graminis f. sp. tritici]